MKDSKGLICRLPSSISFEDIAPAPTFITNCTYCGQSVKFPYLQHDECIKLQIQVEKDSLMPKKEKIEWPNPTEMWINSKWSEVDLSHGSLS